MLPTAPLEVVLSMFFMLCGVSIAVSHAAATICAALLQVTCCLLLQLSMLCYL
jgi:hypothetical protein